MDLDFFDNLSRRVKGLNVDRARDDFLGIGKMLFRRHVRRMFEQMVRPISTSGYDMLNDIPNWRRRTKEAYLLGSAEQTTAAWFASEALRQQLELLTPENRDQVLSAIKNNTPASEGLRMLVLTFIHICLRAPNFTHAEAFAKLMKGEISAA